MWYGVNIFVSIGLGRGSLRPYIGSHLFYAQIEWEPHMGSHWDESSHALGMCLTVYVPQLILWEISSTVWF